jgi:hypothetical protein
MLGRGRLPLAILMMSVLMLFAFGTPLQSADAFKLDQGGHYGITERALPFLTPIALYEINKGHHVADWEDKVGGMFSAKQHFDNCRFRDGTMLINDFYNQILNTPRENIPYDKDVRIKFGRILHAAQDFYSHTNWVELGLSDLVDPKKDRLWKVMTPGLGGTVRGDIFVGEGADPGQGWKVTFYPKSLKAFAEYNNPGHSAHGRTFWVLISGLVPYEIKGNFLDVNCPAKARTGHWPWLAGSPYIPSLIALIPGIPAGLKVMALFASVVTPGTPGLAKDNPPGQNDNPNDPKFLNHFTAKRLAEKQTYNEFCRLLNLVEETHGPATKELLARVWIKYPFTIPISDPAGTRWVANPEFDAAVKDCPIARAIASKGPAAPEEKAETSSLKALEDRMSKSPPPTIDNPPPVEQPGVEVIEPPEDPCEGLSDEECFGITEPGGSGSSSGSGGGPDITIDPVDPPPSSQGQPGEIPAPPDPDGSGGAS